MACIVNHMVKHLADEMDGIFHALSDQTRRAILARLAEGECNVTELASPFQMSLAAVSKHIKVLEEAGLVEKIKEGRTFRCRPKFDRLSDANALLHQLADFWQGRLDALDSFFSNEVTQGTNDGNSHRSNDPKVGNKKDSARKKRKGV